MLITISTTHRPATDMGYLLGKHPDRFQNFEMSFGEANVFYPEASEERCTIALLLKVDPVKLARRNGAGPRPEHYVNTRPYVAASHMAIALNRVFRSAAAGVCKEKPELADTPIPLEVRIPAAPAGRRRANPESLFQPLGYHTDTVRHPLDERFPEWGDSPYVGLTLKHEITLKELINHLYVLLPVLDGNRHHYLGDDEVEKLLRFGEGWLTNHPQRDLITQTFLKDQRGMIRDALEQMPTPDREGPETGSESQEREEQQLERPMKLADQRANAVITALKGHGAAHVLDLGCGEGRLTLAMSKENSFRTITALETSHQALRTLTNRLNRLPSHQKEKVTMLHGSLVYRDNRLKDHDAAVAMEVIEHIDPPKLGYFEDAVFGLAGPKTLIITTPNQEYNTLFEGLSPTAMRHRDHRFEWTRTEFQEWAKRTAQLYGYKAAFQDIGPEDPKLGAPTQMAVFTKLDGN